MLTAALPPTGALPWLCGKRQIPGRSLTPWCSRLTPGAGLYPGPAPGEASAVSPAQKAATRSSSRISCLFLPGFPPHLLPQYLCTCPSHSPPPLHDSAGQPPAFSPLPRLLQRLGSCATAPWVRSPQGPALGWVLVFPFLSTDPSACVAPASRSRFSPSGQTRLHTGPQHWAATRVPHL